MSLKSLISTTTLIVALFAQNAQAAEPPLSQEERQKFASYIATGYVTSFQKAYQDVSYGCNVFLYTVKMLVTSVEKGSDITNGQTISFHYWKAESRGSGSGWCGDGQYGTVKRFDIIKAYLSLDMETGQLRLLNPNGFDIVK
jgi:hypothetical protein